MNLRNAIPEKGPEHRGNPEKPPRDHEKSWLRFTIIVIVSVIFIDSLINIARLNPTQEPPYHDAWNNRFSSGKGTVSQTNNAQLVPSKDNTLYEDVGGNISNGAGDYFFVGTTNTGMIRRGVIAFDIAGSIPAGSTVTRASLTLNMSRTISADQSVGLHRLTLDWGEGASDAPAQEGGGSPAEMGDATWLHRFHDTDLWIAPGGDFLTTSSATISVSGIGFHAWGPTSAMIADVQDWLDNPQTNFGWLIMGDESTMGTAKRFDSRENFNPSNRPVLAVEYMEPGSIIPSNPVVQYILGINNDPTGLDLNGDGAIDAADVIISNLEVTTNQAPIVASHPIYRAHPGFSIALPINAADPEATALSYTAMDLPIGASLDPETGLFRWVPADNQLGPAYVHFTVTDSGEPVQASNGILIFQIFPLDNCVIPICDPATGCDFIPQPITQDCCGGEPEIRIAEPEAPCPEGLVLHVGRNKRGFGRLQNCDFLPVVLFGQGGTNVTLHFETRCVNDTQPVTIRSRLETADELLFDEEQNAQLTSRPDGFSQVLGLTFAVSFGIDAFALEGKEAMLTSTLTDADGVRVERQLRLTLTLGEPDDILNPNQIIAPAGEIGCIGCHRPRNPITQVRAGIEDAHPWFELSCIDCHGGNDQVNTFEDAHVFPASGPTFIRNLAYDQLNQVPLDYVRFINPGDLRVAQQSCGSSSPANPGGGCHQSIVATVPGSVMSTYAGHYKLPRFMAGGQGRDPILAAVDITDPDYDPETAPAGTVPFLEALREPTQADRSELIAAMDIYLPKSCATCHLSDFGRNNGPGKYRSSGCTACHMLYDNDGLSQSMDPAIFGYFPPHPIEHQLTTSIPTEQCTHCHFQGGRIGLAFRGIREGGFSPENTPPNAVPWGQSIYGHDPDFYFVDEDDTNSVDETPPDLHFSAGMVCMDCHVGRDVHGDGYIYASERDQVGIRCEDCHGKVREAIQEDPADGFFKNSQGYPMKRVKREGGNIVLELATHDTKLVIPQIFERLQAGTNPRMVEAMGVKPSGFAHPDKLECYTCHNAWRQTCFGCHVTINDDVRQYNLTTGLTSQGGITVSRDNFSTDFFTMGTNDRGKITALCSSMSIFVSYMKDREFQYRDRIRMTTEGTKGFGWNPFHHHTVSRKPMNCNTCHPVDSIDNPTNAGQLRETYGFGNGQIIATDDEGTTHDLTAYLDENGDLMSTFAHPNTGPVSAEIRARALSILVTPQAR